MLVKARPVPFQLIVLRILNTRGDLSDDERGNYFSFKKGYEGELLFDSMTEKLQCEVYVINDLLLEVNNNEFQIDTLLILNRVIHLCEVKYFIGDHFYSDGKFYHITRPDLEINNPLHQLERKVTLLRQFLKKHGYNFPIEPHLIFDHPEFTLLQAPIDQPIILPTQLNRFIDNLNSTPSMLNETHKKMADILVASHKPKSANMRLPQYTYEDLQKGPTCARCDSFSQTIMGGRLICGDCGFEEKIDSIVMRAVREIMILFPEMKVTTGLVWEWCGGVVSQKTIARVLKRALQQVGYGQWTYYIQKN